MALTFKEIDLVAEGNFIHIKITGKLSVEDYEFFVPEVVSQIEKHGKVNMLVELIDFHGWTAGAMWEDTKFGVRHFNDINRMAVVGENAWEKGMAYFAQVFSTASVKYFDVKDRKKALAWISEA